MTFDELQNKFTEMHKKYRNDEYPTHYDFECLLSLIVDHIPNNIIEKAIEEYRKIYL